MIFRLTSSFFFFFNDTATTEIYTLSLHDALPIWKDREGASVGLAPRDSDEDPHRSLPDVRGDRRHRPRSEEHTSELQSRLHLVCRLLLEKKKQSEPFCRRVLDQIGRVQLTEHVLT